MVSRRVSILCAAAGFAVANAAIATAAPPSIPATTQLSQEPPPGFVSRQEFDALARDQARLREELDALRREHVASETRPADATPAARQEDVDALDESVRDIRRNLDRYQNPDSRFLLVGDATFGFAAPRHGASTFSTTISPLVLWRPAERVLVEAAADFSVGTDANGNSSTSVNLTIGNASFLVNDYLAVGAGLFVVPFGQYHNHFDPPWIKELPDDPLPFGDNPIAPSSEVGAFAKGAVPAEVVGRPVKFTYDLYVTDGPQLVTTDPAAAGTLNFDDFTDTNGNKAVGGRIGFLPAPDLELGYSWQSSDPSPAGFQPTHAFLQAFDFNWRPHVEPLRGWIDLRAEYVASHVGRVTYDPHGKIGFGPLHFGNEREGGYIQIAYRPAYVENDFVRRLEFVGRYDWLNGPLRSPGGNHEHRYTLGVDYWITPQTVFEAAYEWDRRSVGPRQDVLLLQLGVRL